MVYLKRCTVLLAANANQYLEHDTIAILHTYDNIYTFAVMAKGKPTTRASSKLKTVQRTYRFDAKLFGAFEDDCARHLSNPKRVIEAAIIHWLEADPDTRVAMAQKHRAQIANGQQDD